MVGPPTTVFPALDKFWRQVEDYAGLQRQRNKCKIFTWDGIKLPHMPDDMPMATETIEGRIEPGFICYGIPIGSDQYVKYMLRKKFKEVEDNAKKASGTYGSRV